LGHACGAVLATPRVDGQASGRPIALCTSWRADVGEATLGELGMVRQRGHGGEREAQVFEVQAPLEHEPGDPAGRGAIK
jgi:hypothetical protein